MRSLHRRTDKHACNPARIRTKINYKVSITLYLVAVKFINTIYRYLEWQNTISCSRKPRRLRTGLPIYKQGSNCFYSAIS